MGKPPLQSIAFATVLLVLGVVFVVLGFMFLTGYLETEFWRRGFIFVGMGSLLIIPGAYVIFIAVNVMLGGKGYTWAHIPE